MKKFVVFEHERVDVTQMGAVDPEYVHGDLLCSYIIEATNGDEAIRKLSRPGMYSAMEVPDDLHVQEATIVVKSSGHDPVLEKE